MQNTLRSLVINARCMICCVWLDTLSRKSKINTNLHTPIHKPKVKEYEYYYLILESFKGHSIVTQKSKDIRCLVFSMKDFYTVLKQEQNLT